MGDMQTIVRSPSLGTITKAAGTFDISASSREKVDPKISKPEPKISKSAPVSEYVPEVLARKQISHSSLRSDEDGVTRGREINDTFMGRLLYLQYSFFSLISTSLLIYVLHGLAQDEGITLPFGGKTFHQTVPVILEAWMHICFLLTDTAISRALAAYFGYELSQKHGYSLIVCGFIQSSMFAKIQFSNLLNFRSKYKKVISRASMTWALHLAFLIFTFFCATAITISTTRYDSGDLLCVEFGQDGVPVDRGWPNIETESGVAEFIFGSSLGLLSSEHGTSNSTLVTYPQLIDACADGTFIIGKGLTTNFQTTCDCSASNSISHVIDAGVPSKEVAAVMLKSFDELNMGAAWINYISKSDDYSSINITTILTGNALCGGANYANWSIPVCTTVFGDHNFADVQISWMNDGHPARSTANSVTLLNSGDPADKAWLYQALLNAFGGTHSHHYLPGFYPGTVNPLFWWMTPNLQALSLSAFVPGLETSMAMMIKVGITRTYSVTGKSCIQNLEDGLKTTLRISSSGFTLGLIFATFELVLIVFSILGCVPWFICKDPIIPAIRMVSDRTYFNIMLCKNSTGNLLRIIGSTAVLTDIWPKLDMEVRVGENIQTVSDQDTGEIIVDKPKLVTNLSWNKCY